MVVADSYPRLGFRLGGAQQWHRGFPGVVAHAVYDKILDAYGMKGRQKETRLSINHARARARAVSSYEPEIIC